MEDENITSMTTALRTSDQAIVLEGVRWETYERLLADQQESSGTRLNYDCGTLEIMAPSSEHERLNDAIRLLFQLLAGEMGIEVLAVGSTTFRRQDLLKGFEPDGSFYIQHAETLRAKDRIALSVDPPPDLVIEIEITNPMMGKMSIFAAAGVPEVWLYRQNHIEIMGLEANTYHQRVGSSFLPGVTDSVLTEFVRSSKTMQSSAWIKSVRGWAANH